MRLDTMESRLTPGLHLAGEILDVDGRVGGFNFQWAWASGHVAGEAAARAVAGVVGDGGASIVGFLFAVGVMAGAERAKSQERLLDLAALAGLCCACRGTALAACPFAFAVDYSVGNVEAAAWRDVCRRLFCALLVVAVIGSVCV